MEANHEIIIPGLDTESGIRQSGSFNMYMELLCDVYGIIEKKCAETEKYLKEGDLKSFTTTVHSLKTTCRMIGHNSLSESFLELEMIGKEGSLEKAMDKTPDVLARFRELKTLLEPYAVKEQDDKIPFSIEECNALLTEIEKAADDFDIISAEEAIKKLLTYQCDKELSDKLSQLSTFVNELDYDEAKALCTEIKSLIK